MGHEWMRATTHRAHWGVGRHVLGSQVFDYWCGAQDGFRVEHYADGDLYDNKVPATTVEGTHEQLWSWGPRMQRRFFSRRAISDSQSASTAATPWSASGTAEQCQRPFQSSTNRTAAPHFVAEFKEIMSYQAPLKDMLFVHDRTRRPRQGGHAARLRGRRPRHRAGRARGMRALQRGRDRAAERRGRQAPLELEGRRSDHHARLQGRLRASTPRAAGRACSIPPTSAARACPRPSARPASRSSTAPT